MQDISFKEYSFVNLPADGKSSVRNTQVISDGKAVSSSEDWVAKSSAFVLHMNEEDIYSVEENESILKNMKKKESRPLYLQLKGSFLTALAIQESETENSNPNSLLSSEDVEKANIQQENSNMNEKVKDEDILAALEVLTGTASETPSEEEVKEESKPEETIEEGAEEASEAEVTAEEQTAAEAAAAVQKVLNEMVVLGFVAQRAHWNVVGVDFQEYHALFASIYDDIFDSIDAVAEEIRKMDVMVANLTNMVMSAGFKDDIDSSDARALTEDVLNKNMMLNETVLAAFAACTAVNAQGTADLMAARDGMHKKWSWQLKASLGMEAGEPADESWKEFNKGSEEVEESKEEPTEEVVDSQESAATEENQEVEVSKADLTDETVVSEQDAEEATSKFQLLEEENEKLKKALHRVLVERVVDAKIEAGLESYEDRDRLISEHSARTAASLADSLRDVEKLPAKKAHAHTMPEISMESEVVTTENDERVISEDEETVSEKKEVSVEQVFVDALMGRRKL